MSKGTSLMMGLPVNFSRIADDISNLLLPLWRVNVLSKAKRFRISLLHLSEDSTLCWVPGPLPLHPCTQGHGYSSHNNPRFKAQCSL